MCKQTTWVFLCNGSWTDDWLIFTPILSTNCKDLASWTGCHKGRAAVIWEKNAYIWFLDLLIAFKALYIVCVQSMDHVSAQVPTLPIKYWIDIFVWHTAPILLVHTLWSWMTWCSVPFWVLQLQYVWSSLVLCVWLQRGDKTKYEV